jgi:hypothetical protein
MNRPVAIGLAVGAALCWFLPGFNAVFFSPSDINRNRMGDVLTGFWGTILSVNPLGAFELKGLDPLCPLSLIPVGIDQSVDCDDRAPRH